MLAAIKEQDGEDGEEDETTPNTRRSKHCFMRILGLVISDKHRQLFFQSRLSCTRRELDNKQTGKKRGVWVGIAEDYRNKELEVTAVYIRSSTSAVPDFSAPVNPPVLLLLPQPCSYSSLCIIYVSGRA